MSYWNSMAWTAMADRRVTPEEKLLRLIESGEKGAIGQRNRKGAKFWNPKGWARVLFARREKAIRIRPGAGWSPEINLAWINRSLIILFILVLAGIVLSMNHIRTLPKNLAVQAAGLGFAAGDDVAGQKAVASLRPLKDYLEEVSKRDIFNPMPVQKTKKPKKPEKKPEPVTPPLSNPSIVLQEKVKTLKLVGISWGKNPVAMIEDKNKQGTSFLKVGDSINEVQVKAILKDRAVLSYKDAEYDLF